MYSTPAVNTPFRLRCSQNLSSPQVARSSLFHVKHWGRRCDPTAGWCHVKLALRKTAYNRSAGAYQLLALAGGRPCFLTAGLRLVNLFHSRGDGLGRVVICQGLSACRR